MGTNCSQMLNSAAISSFVCIKKPGETNLSMLYSLIHESFSYKIWFPSIFRHRKERALKGQEPLLVLLMMVEKGYTALLPQNLVAPAGLNFYSALHFHSHICLGACLCGKIIAHGAGIWINSTSLQRTSQVQWGLVRTRTLLWTQPRCKSPALWHQLPHAHCWCTWGLHGLPGPSWAPHTQCPYALMARVLLNQEKPRCIWWFASWDDAMTINDRHWYIYSCKLLEFLLQKGSWDVKVHEILQMLDFKVGVDSRNWYPVPQYCTLVISSLIIAPAFIYPIKVFSHLTAPLDI